MIYNYMLLLLCLGTLLCPSHPYPFFEAELYTNASMKTNEFSGSELQDVLHTSRPYHCIWHSRVWMKQMSFVSHVSRLSPNDSIKRLLGFIKMSNLLDYTAIKIMLPKLITANENLYISIMQKTEVIFFRRKSITLCW